MLDRRVQQGHSEETEPMTETEKAVEEQLPTGRFVLGVIFFGLGLICPVFVPVVVATGLPAAWKTVLSGIFMLGLPEVFCLLAVLVLGKEGFNFIKRRLFRFIKRHALPQTVGRPRYYAGLVLFSLPLAFAWLEPYISGLLPDYGHHRLKFAIGGDVVLLSSLFMLGGDFWDKLRSLFVYEARVEFPSR
jgi:hypothetical protein